LFNNLNNILPNKIMYLIKYFLPKWLNYSKKGTTIYLIYLFTCLILGILGSIVYSSILYFNLEGVCEFYLEKLKESRLHSK